MPLVFIDNSNSFNSLNLQEGQLDHSSAKDTADTNQLQLVLFKGFLSQACTDLLNTELHALKISKQLPKNCPYLHLVCPEVRIQIFKHLLVDPGLADCFDIESGSINRQARCRLYPAILRICRKFYEEGSEVLYGSNIISISCLPARGRFVDLPLFSSPLIRSEIVWDELDDNPFDRPHRTPYGVEHILLEQIPGFSLVRNWKILIAPFTTRKAPLGDCIIRELLVFCRAASQNTMKSIAIQPICDHSQYPDEDQDLLPLHELLSPLTLFREIKFLTVSTSNVSFNLTSGAVLPRDIHSLVEGNSPIYRVFTMYRHLLTYAQAFERCKQFKADMGRAVPSSRIFFKNPYMADSRHPVEEALNMAKDAANGNDWNAFLVQRSIVVNFLEAQYQRISKACAALQGMRNDPVGRPPRTVRPGKLRARLVPNFRNGQNQKDLRSLEDYAAAFTRDTTPETDLAIVRLGLKKFLRTYWTVDREMTMKQLNWAMGEGDFESARELFNRALNYMDAQFDEIKQARQELFTFDPPGSSPGCSISLDD